MIVEDKKRVFPLNPDATELLTLLNCNRTHFRYAISRTSAAWNSW